MFRSTFSTALAAFALAVAIEPAAAVTRNWLNAAGGAADLPANWNPSAVPAVADLLRFDLPNTFTVTFGSGADSVDTHQFYRGDVSYSLGADHGVRTGFHVAPLVNQVATARILSGNLRLGWSASVGAGGSATGTLRIAGGSTNVSQNVAGAPAAGPVMNIGGTAVGGGTGEVAVLNGGQLDLAYHLNVGRFAGSTGTLRVRGAGNGANGLRRSHVFADSSGADCHLGMDNGHGILEVKEGGLFRVGRDLIVGEDLGDVGEITIDGQNAIDSSNVRVKDDLWVAANMTAGVPGGSGTITVDTVGVLVVDDSTVVGESDGSAGLITLKNRSRMVTRHLILRQPTGNSMDFQGGLLQVKGGSLSTNTGRLTIPGGANNLVMPVLELINGAQATFSGTPADPPLTIGSTGYAQFSVYGESHLVADGGNLTVQKGYLVVDSGGEVTSNRVGLLGPNGYGYLILHGGGQATFPGLDLGDGASGLGGVIMDGEGSTLNLNGPLNVGGSTLFGGSRGQASVGIGSVLNLLSPIDAGTLWNGPSGPNQLAIAGRLNLTGRLTVRDQLFMADGEILGGSIALRDSGLIVGDGTVQSAILAGTDTTVTITATSQLEIGRDAAGGDVLMRGTTNVGSTYLFVHDPDSAVVGNVIIDGGSLSLPSGGGVIETGKRLFGEGSVYGPLVDHGYLISQGASGLRFGGTLFGTGQGAGGDLFRFLAGGGFEGSGTIDAKIQADAGSLIRATGALYLGKAGLTDALILKGRIEAGANSLHLTNSDTTIVQGQLVLDGANVLAIGGFSPYIGNGGRLEGRGNIGPGLVVNGTVAPGHSAGRLDVNGPCTFGLGIFEAELGDHAATEHDTLVVFGPVALAGNLALRRLSSYAASPGDSFQILVCEALAGTFASVTLDGAPLAGEFEIHYAANGVWIVVAQPTVDVPRDPPGSAPVFALQLAPMASPGQRPGIELALPTAAAAIVRAFDITGREIGMLWEGELGAGRHRFELTGDRAGAGVFFVRAWIDDRNGRVVKTVRLVRLR